MHKNYAIAGIITSILTGCGGDSGSSTAPENSSAPGNGLVTPDAIVYKNDLSADLSQTAIIMLLDDMVQNSPGWNASHQIRNTGRFPRAFQYRFLSDLPAENISAEATPCANGGSAADEITNDNGAATLDKGDADFHLSFDNCLENIRLPHYSYEFFVNGTISGHSEWISSENDSNTLSSLKASASGNIEQRLAVYTNQGKAALLLRYSDDNSSTSMSNDGRTILLDENYTAYIEAHFAENETDTHPIGGEFTVTTLESLHYATDRALWFPQAGKLQVADSDQVAVIEFTGDDTYTVSIDGQTFNMDYQYFGGAVLQGLLIKANMEDMKGVGFRTAYIDGWTSTVPVALFNNGDASYDITNVLNPAGISASKAQYPGDWKQWKQDENGVHFGVEGNWSKLPYDEIKTQTDKNFRLNGSYENIGGSSDTAFNISQMTFADNGTFSRSSIVSFDHENSLNGSWVGGVFEYPREQGEYEIDGFLLTMRYGSGLTVYKVIVYYTNDDGKVDFFLLNNSAYVN